MRSSFADILPVYGLVASILVLCVVADYRVDNANNTVVYAPSETRWETYSFATQNLTLVLPGGNSTVDSSKCYDQNYALAACTVDNMCQITFPFTGSGISVYVMHAGFQGVSARLTIDGGQNITASLPAPAPPSYQTPNVSLFNLQSLPSADHTATINLLDWNNGTTSLYFDYALINESYVELLVPSSATSYSSSVVTNHITTTSTLQPPTTQGSTHTSGATFSTSSRSGVNVSAVVGGACGGLAGLLIIVTATIFLKKRRSQCAELEESRKPDPFLATPAPGHDHVLFSVHPQTNEKRRMLLAAPHAASHHSPMQPGGELSSFLIVSDVGSA